MKCIINAKSINHAKRKWYQAKERVSLDGIHKDNTCASLSAHSTRVLSLDGVRLVQENCFEIFKSCVFKPWKWPSSSQWNVIT